MPPLTSFYILQKEFTKARNGYATDQVHAFLDKVAKDFSQMQDELTRLRKQSEDRTSEETIARTLLRAQHIADQTVSDAKSKAHTMVAEAEALAEDTTEHAQMQARISEEQARKRISQMDERLARRRQELDRAIETLREFERDYRVRLRGFVEGQLKLLEDATPVDSLAPPSSALEGVPGWDDKLPVPSAATTTPAGSDQSRRDTGEQLSSNGNSGADQLPARP